MDFMIQPEDLMSDIEPLPFSATSSAPASPRTRLAFPASDPVAWSLSPCMALSSSAEVTAGLYASLEASRCPASERWPRVGAGEGSVEAPQEPPGERRLARGGPRPGSAPASRGRGEAAEHIQGACLRAYSTHGSCSGNAGSRPLAQTWALGTDAVAEEISVPQRPGLACSSKDTDSLDRLAPTDAEELAVEMTQKLCKGIESSSGQKVESRHISEMESVRSHLQNMLKFSQDLTDRNDAVSVAGAQCRHHDSFRSECTSSLLRAKPFQEVSVSLPMPLLGLDEAALFPRYSHMRLGTGAGLVSESSLYEYQILKDTLDKERTRRKHCEEQIQDLQNKILQLQQQLAVAVSADRKKDVMIEQLDKTLMKVVEGWKKHDVERSEAMRQLQEEHEAVEQERGERQQVLMNFEHHLSQATQALAREQQEKEQLEKERGLLECEAKELREALQAERQGRLKLQAECEQAEHGRLHERSQAEVLRAQLAEEQEAGVKRVRELEQWSAQREEQLQKEIEKERVATQRESQRGQDAQQVLSAVQDETRRLESELDAVSRDKESLRVELSLEKARFESQRVQSEAEFKVALEQQVTERLTALHEDSSHQMAVMREQHRKQIVEVTMQHEHEMGKQLAEFQQELQEREEKHRHVVEGYELRLAKGQEETSRLLAVNRKLQVQRSEMVSKLQAMMQSHWNEALRVLMSEHSPNAPPQLQPPALHHNQVSVYQELHRSLSSSEAQHSATSADRSLSSSSVPPCPSPTLDSERLQLFMSARGSGDSVAQSCLDQLVKTVQGSGPNLTEPILDHQAPRGGMESGQPPDMSARDPRFPGAVPLWPVTQISCWPVPVDRGVPPLQGLALAGWNGGRALELPPAVPRTQNGDQHQRPMLPDPHSVEDLSHLLNCSFLSRASFQPLEPQVDETIAAPEPPAEELAEHPFTDAEVGGQQPSEGVMAPDVSFSSSSSRSFQDQSSRSSELQYYIQMLLDRPPSDPLDANADAEPPNVMPQAAEPQQAGAPIILAHSSTWETARPQPMGQLSTSQNAKPLSSAVQKVKISPPQSVPTQRGFAQNPGLAGGVLSPKQVGQLSRLLSTYTGTSDRPAPSMDELFTYLRDVQDNRLIGPEILASTAQGNQDQKMNQTTKKEGVPAQKRFTNKPDKGSNSSKEKRRPLPSSQGGGSKGARLSIWR